MGGDVNSKSSFPFTYPLPSSSSRKSEDNETRMDGKHVTAIAIASREKKIKKYEKRLRNIARFEHKVEKHGDSSLTDEQRDKLEAIATSNHINRILSKVQKSFWSCTHVNSCQNYALYVNLHILLNILCKTTLNIQESRKSIKFLKR